jgi:hypothetical protein
MLKPYLKALPVIASTLLSLAISSAVIAKDDFSIQGKLGIDNENISGLVVTENFAALATDEGTEMQILPRQSDTFIAKKSGIIRLTNNEDELDLEGLAWQAPYLYAIGSHSHKRKKIKTDASEKKNFKRLSKIVHEPSRHQLFQLELSDNGKFKYIRSLSLDKWLVENEILAPFSKLPSKENGVDIEGIAVTENHLYVGFRGPVLRGNLAAILRFNLKADKFRLNKPELQLVNLGGLGIRDMLATEDRLILLAGPVSEEPRRFAIFNWDGTTRFQAMSPLKTLNSPAAKPEAIALDSRKANVVWMAQDGLSNGGIQLLPLSE